MLRADPWLPAPMRIVERTRETSDVFTLTLDAEGFAFEPGQFNMLYVFGVGEAAISISGDRMHTIRAVGSVTKALGALKPGATVGVRGPYGRGWPLADAEGSDLVVVAGGVGLPPLRPVLYDALARPGRYRRVVLLYGARTPEDLVFRAELDAWARRIEVHVTVDHAGPGWSGRVGVVPALLDETKIDPSRTIAMLCGPEVMMRFAVRALADRGVPRERVFVSLERNMKCAIGFCGHCQYGPTFVCKDGPVVRFDRVAWLFDRREI